jgi:hypothetical protein
MHTLLLPLTPRFIVYTLCLLGFAAALALLWVRPDWTWGLTIPLGLFGGFAVLGTRDLFQTRHAVLRNYPISAHLRFLLEGIRPELRQYFFEGEKDGAPFSRDKWAVVY